MGDEVPELLVVSDTHGDSGVLATILRWGRRRGVGALAHLGDGARDLEEAFAEARWTAPYRAVGGNMDWEGGTGGSCRPAELFEFAGKRFLLVHGHLEGVAEGYGRLVTAAREARADAVLFGHTHRPFWEEIDGLLVLNPGSPSRPRWSGPPSFATIAIPRDGWFLIRYWAVEPGGRGGVKPYEGGLPR